MDNQVYHLSKKKYKRRGYQKNKIHYLLILLAVVLFIVLMFFLVFNNNTNIIMARYGEVVDGFSTEVLIVRDETITYSPLSGYITLLKKEGNRVGYGNAVLKIDQSHLYNYQSGIISYASDGLEEELRPAYLKKMTVERINTLNRDYQQLVNGDHVNEGQAGFRIVNNNFMYIVVKVTSKELERYRNNETIFLESEDFDQGLIDGQIIAKKSAEKEGLLIIKLNIFVKEWLNQRQVNVYFIKNIYRGIIIPRKSLFTQPEGEGVLAYKADGSYSFKKVKVVDGNEDDVVVEGLEVGESVIVNPASVNYGRGV